MKTLSFLFLSVLSLSNFANIVDEVIYKGDTCTIESIARESSQDQDIVTRTTTIDFDTDIFTLTVTSEELFQRFFIQQEVGSATSTLGADFSGKKKGENYILTVTYKAYLNVITKNYLDQKTVYTFKRGQKMPLKVTFTDVEMRKRLFGGGYREVRNSRRQASCKL